jgi:ABC-type proline/glycine betaine transport system substrate-binding protein
VQNLFAQTKSATYICTMEVNNALEDLLASKAFKEKAKEKNNEGGKLRMFVTRYQRGEISTAAAVTLLEKFGYTVEIFPSKNVKK